MLSAFDMFKIGIGPSSSHTMGPMVAGKRFVDAVAERGLLDRLAGVRVDIYGSLALTGEGHGTCNAMLNGLEGRDPRGVDPEKIVPRALQLREGSDLDFGGRKPIPFVFRRDVVLHKDELLPKHTNGMLFTARDRSGKTLLSLELYSTGGGFVVSADEFGRKSPDAMDVPLPFANATELLQLCHKHGLTIAGLVMENEKACLPEAEVRKGILEIADVMHRCVERGCSRAEEFLPGGLQVRRRAPKLFGKMKELEQKGHTDIRLWPMVFAIAVSEENASGGRIVTAPTNGAAGIVPSILECCCLFSHGWTEDNIVDLLLTSAAIGMIYKMNASISGAEVGCQGEVGVACSMAAGGLAAAMGGTLEQVEDAAEIAMEHHLGLTCDPVAGLVQIPCIERNGIAAEQAIKCAQLAYLEDGRHKVSLDQVAATMFATGKDMQAKYKETSLGGLAQTVEHALC